MKYELGSEFHWENIPKNDVTKWPPNCLFTSMGRAPLIMLWKQFCGPKAKVYIPEYFCEEVIEYWKSYGLNIVFYQDNPTLKEPCFKSLKATDGDIVLAVNYFGMKDGVSWKKWKKINPNILLVEDHTHDPVSVWALTSNSDFCFASLRKTLPISDGAILWSPAKFDIFNDLPDMNLKDSSMKLSAMFLKSLYITDGITEVKDAYRALQIDGEYVLSQLDITKISIMSSIQIKDGYPNSFREKRIRNVKFFDKEFHSIVGAEHLTCSIPLGGSPFAAVILFDSNQKRNYVQKYLISNSVYTPIHWAIDNLDLATASEISNRILTIPFDQRYDESDVYKVIEMIKFSLECYDD
ncbi:hypothetical protein JK628_08290 [Shewanella sp. KX20019]|uniref:hypothetical protein n=1 Tax=Shewanella sp. KX20019 TaxID=2803864 RepID=UPI0019270740|nr:hypothetical protein [Shewanella sp. KX20019]QQX81815.1 hypothetical protein JK628_08290 [Shewanella sp. KX20019]